MLVIIIYSYIALSFSFKDSFLIACLSKFLDLHNKLVDICKEGQLEQLKDVAVKEAATVQTLLCGDVAHKVSRIVYYLLSNFDPQGLVIECFVKILIIL